jgi:hypothetical protein
LRPEIDRQAHFAGQEFDPKQIEGCDGFTDFLEASGLVDIHRSHDADILVAPKGFNISVASQESARPRIRSHFWKAFVTFPRPGEERGYDPALDRVFFSPPDDLESGVVRIEPITKETQLEWGRTFIDSLARENPVRRVDLDEDRGAFSRFAAKLRDYPNIRDEWNRFWFVKVSEAVKNWAQEHDIPDSAWLVLSGSTVSDEEAKVRQRIYRIFDTIPVDDLLNVRIPLRALLDGRPEES